MRGALGLSLAGHLALGLLVLGLGRPRELPVEEAVVVELVTAVEEGAARSTTPAPAAAAPLPPREAAAPAPAPPAPAPPSEPAPPAPERLAVEPEPAHVTPEPARLAPPPPRPRPAPAERAVAEKPPEKPVERPRPSEPPEEARAAPPAPRPAPRPTPPQPAAERPAPPPAKPEPAKKPEPTAKEPPKAEPPRSEVARVEPPRRQAADPPREDSFAALLRSVEQLERRVRADRESPGRGRAEPSPVEPRRGEAGADRSLTPAEIEAIRRQIERCWNVPVGVRGIETMQVRLRIVMNRDGSVARVEIEDAARMAVDPGFRVVAESAQRAVLSCRLELPPDKYEQWREMVMTFHPKDALSG